MATSWLRTMVKTSSNANLAVRTNINPGVKGTPYLARIPSTPAPTHTHHWSVHSKSLYVTNSLVCSRPGHVTPHSSCCSLLQAVCIAPQSPPPLALFFKFDHNCSFRHITDNLHLRLGSLVQVRSQLFISPHHCQTPPPLALLFKFDPNCSFRHITVNLHLPRPSSPRGCSSHNITTSTSLFSPLHSYPLVSSHHRSHHLSSSLIQF